MSRKRSLLAATCLLAIAAAMSFDASRCFVQQFWVTRVIRQPVLDAPQVVDLGPQENGAVADARFTVSNRGGGELKLDSFRTGCACDGLEWEAEGRFVRLTELTLVAGQSANLRLRRSVQGRAGEPLQTAVYFRTNDPAAPEAAVTVVIPKVLGGVTAVPVSQHFGSLSLGASARQVFDLFDPADVTRTVTRVESGDPNRFSVRLLPPDTAALPSGGELPGVPVGRIEAVVHTDRPGAIDGEIRVYLDEGKSKPDVIRITGRVVPPVEVTPSALVLPRASGEGPLYSCICVCRSATGQPLTLDVVEAPPGVTATPEPSDEGSPIRRVTVAVNPALLPAAYETRNHVVRLAAIVSGGRHLIEVPVRVLAPTGAAP
jgi:hypothetical protein